MRLAPKFGREPGWASVVRLLGGAGSFGGRGGQPALEGIEAGEGIEDVGFGEWGLAAEAGGDEAAALVVDAALGVAGDVIDGGADDFRAVSELLVREDGDVRAERSIGDRRDVDAGNVDLDAGVIRRHGRSLSSQSVAAENQDERKSGERNDP